MVGYIGLITRSREGNTHRAEKGGMEPKSLREPCDSHEKNQETFIYFELITGSKIIGTSSKYITRKNDCLCLITSMSKATSIWS